MNSAELRVLNAEVEIPTTPVYRATTQVISMVQLTYDSELSTHN